MSRNKIMLRIENTADRFDFENRQVSNLEVDLV